MNIFLSGNAKIDSVFGPTILLFCIKGRGTKKSSTPQKGNTLPKLFMSYTIHRNYLVILNTLPANIDVHVTISAITAPLIVSNGPNDSIVSGYLHTISKPIIILHICRGEFLYLIPCSIVSSE